MKTWTWRGTLYCTLQSPPKISLYGALKNAQNYEEKDAFYAAVDDSLDSVTKGAPEVTFDGACKDALRDLHKDAQKGVCEVALKGAFEVALEFHLLMQWLMHRCVQNGSSNGGPDAALEGALNGGINVRF